MAEGILVLRIVKTILGLLGIVGNAVTVVVIYKVEFMHTVTDAFVFNQSLIDCLASFVLILVTNIPEPAQFPDTAWYTVLCYAWYSQLLLWTLYASSTANLLAFIVERYIALAHSFRYSRFFRKRCLVGIITAVWLYGVILNGAYTFPVFAHKDGQCVMLSSVVNTILGQVLIVLEFFLPAAVMSFTMLHLLAMLRRRPEYSTPGPSAVAEIHQEPLERARPMTLKTLFVVFATFLICWTPNQVMFWMFNFGFNLDFTGAPYLISVALVAANSCTNPFIFAFKYKRFRRALHSLIYTAFPEEHQMIVSQTADTTL